jgi:pyruvate,orthophosphate dikinase
MSGSPKRIYFFGGGTAEGSGSDKELLGGKGAGLAQMSSLGVPVPPGFTVTTEACKEYHAAGGVFPEGFDEEFRQQLDKLEQLVGRTFGDPRNPLLLSVRSGGPVSMPGMMDTVLNLGMNDALVAAQIESGWDERFLRDCYRRLIGMYGDVVMGVPHSGFEKILAEVREREGASYDAEISAAGLKEVGERSLEYIRESGAEFPQDPMTQLMGGVRAVFDSWNVQRARDYRRLHGLTEDSGTGVNVQTMVFGNRGSRCATGVAFTRDPSTGENTIYGEYLVNAQGEDVVAGIRTPQPIAPAEGGGLGELFPEAFAALKDVCVTLEQERQEMQDVEFTIEDEMLYMLQTRTGKRSGPAAVRIAVEMVEEGLISREEAFRRIDASHITQMLAPVFDTREMEKAIEAGDMLAKGLAAGPGAASGRIALTADRAAEMAAEGPVLLVRDETSPEDIVGMHASSGILTSRGGMTSHAAVVARGLGKPCIVGAGDLVVDEEAGELRVGDRVFREGDVLSIDGTAGQVFAGEHDPHPSEVLQALSSPGDTDLSGAPQRFLELLEWSDEERRMGVRANADTPHDAEVAVMLGARGIGLCRTEHMFFDERRIAWIRQVILAREAKDRATALAALLPEQQSDFEGIFRAMAGMPVTVRLLDPPLHEFLPREESAIRDLAEQMGLNETTVAETVESLTEANPMLGHRGCRLGLTSPEIYDMQVEAITRAACVLHGEGVDARPEIMVPLVGTETEMATLRERIAATVARVLEESGQEIPIPIGTMIEVPRAALVADAIAAHADFFSFGTNDLTQMTYGYSRDDIGRFLPQYVEEGILPVDPFAQLDQEGVGSLVALACEKGRATRSDLKLGICGEHGGDPPSIDFFESCGLDYVSCSPYRVPVARVAAAKASLRRRDAS